MSATKAQLIAGVQEYCRAETAKDREAWLALFAEGAIHEDPVGRTLNAGVEKIAAFWDRVVAANVELWCEEPVIVCGTEAVAIMRCRTGPPDNRRESGRIVDHFVFDGLGKITSLRAFYNYGS
jgi:hypothetical protein